MFILLGNSLAPSLRDYFKASVASDASIHQLPASLWKFSAGQAFSEHFGDVKGKPVVVMQSLGSVDTHSTNDFAMQTLEVVKELKRAEASSVWVVAPYSGYGRQDRMVDGRFVSIGIDTFSCCLKAVGADGFSTVHMHSDAGFEEMVNHFGEKQSFNLPTDEIFSQYAKQNLEVHKLVTGGPDDGAHDFAGAMADALGINRFGFKKQHIGVNDTEVIGFEGDVNNLTTLTVDDEIDTAGTITNAQNRLKDEGAAKRIVGATHAVFSQGGLERVFTAGARDDRLISEILVTDSIDLTFEAERLRRQYDDLDDMSRIKVLPLGPMLWKHVKEDIATHPVMKMGGV